MRARGILPVVFVGAGLVACAPGANKNEPAPPGGNLGDDAGATFDVGGGPAPGLDASIDTAPVDPTIDPKTCDEAATRHTYVGCDYWPTVVANNVWSVFDYAVVVANAGDQPADVHVTGNGVDQTVTVAPNALQKIYLPWVPTLKGEDFVECAPTPLKQSVLQKGGAYHLVSTRPVTVYQFNALEYHGSGGPPGKSWAACPPAGYCKAGKLDCYSYSNDASLLMPSTALTGNVRVTAMAGWTDTSVSPALDVNDAYFTITATQDGTHVTIRIGSSGLVLAGAGIAATKAGEILELDMNAGDVAELACTGGHACDPSGSLVQATHPVQVITGIPCTNIPNNLPTCDHIEESVLPAETFGKKYFVTVPTAPRSNIVGHVVRFYGNVDGTTLRYAPSKPPGAPSSLSAGQVVEVPVAADFEVTGDHEFAVGSFMIGSANLDPYTAPPKQDGDPAQSNVAAVEQYRKKYVILTPDDYDMAFLDMVAPTGTQVFLDGAPITTYVSDAPIADGMSAIRVKLERANEGAHVLTAAEPFGLQVIGYGAYTSYYYPGGLNLDAIAPPPPPIK